MTNKSPWIAFGVLALSLSFAAGCAATAGNWPLKGEADLSSGFGDYRRSRFHAGLDLRTGGVTGREVIAPVDGTVQRVKMSYTGYGKGLYFKGDDGFLYVFGHLSGFAEPIARRVKAAQLKEQRYYVDLFLDTDSIRVLKGQLLAYSGQTGAGAPHLHFEKRTADNVPLNPLTHGFTLKDKVKPTITAVGFQLLDSNSVFADGSRKYFSDVKNAKKSSQPTLGHTPFINKPFGIMVECFDRMRADGMKQAVYNLTLSIDKMPVYTTALDTLDYAEAKSADFEYDYVSALGENLPVRKLFHEPGNEFRGSRGLNNNNGMIRDLPPGRHVASITAVDAFGNKTELTFDFLWNQSEHLYKLDSSSRGEDRVSADFHLSPATDLVPFGIDSVRVLINQGTAWGLPSNGKLVPLPEGRLRFEARGKSIELVPMRLQVFAKKGATFDDLLFNGMQDYGSPKLEVSHRALDDVLRVVGMTRPGPAGRGRLHLFYQDSLLGVEYSPRFINRQTYLFAVPPVAKYRRVDEVMVITNNDSTLKGISSDSLSLGVAGYDTLSLSSLDGLFRLQFTESTFYQPRWVEVRRRPLLVKSLYNLASELYVVYPDEFITRQSFQASLKLKVDHADYQKAGLCRLDADSSTWNWIAPAGADSVAAARVSRGGVYAAVWDLEAPKIDKLNVRQYQIVKERLPVFSFNLTDDLSGFEDDRNIVIKLDGQWLIPEYDPETTICQTRPNEPLDAGEHVLSIEVTDRVGNTTSHEVKFRSTMPPRSADGKS